VINMTGTGTNEILFVGNVSTAIADVQSPDKLPIEVCSNIAEAEELAVKKTFAAILVVISSSPASLRSRLATLREKTSAKILLLARMHEEPLAKVLAGPGSGLADDYVICPVSSEQLCKAVRGPTTVEDTTTTAADATTRKKFLQLEKLATEDDLTGLKNRRYVLEFARQIIKRA
jgi:DNA-binding response OmpR family regulator